MVYNSDKDSTILMIQWCIWKHLGQQLIMDGEKLQRLAEALSYEFFDEGMRMPMDDDDTETPLTLTAELMIINAEMGPLPITQKHLRERLRTAGKKLYGRGWRKFATSAAAMFLMDLWANSALLS